jgi:hypothetical protein
MKNVTGFLIVAFVLSIFFMGCKKDDDTPKNQMKYNDVEYDLSQGFLESYGKWGNNTANSFALILLSPGFTAHDEYGEIDSVSGIGHGIVFDMFATSPDKLDVGDYIYVSVGSGNAGTFDYANGVFDYNAQTEEGGEFDINGGKLTVVQNGDTYELKFDCTTEEGKQVTGFYKGSLKYYNVSDDFKSSKETINSNFFK